MRSLGLLVAAVLAVPLVWMGIARPRRLREKWNAERRVASTSKLLAEAKTAVRFENWERFEASRELLSLESHCTDNELRTTLNALWKEACAEDQGRRGRDTNFFELYDSGIASILEELDRRVGGT